MSKELEVTPGPWHVEAHSRGAGHINVTGPRLLPRPRFGPVAAAYTNLAGPMDDSCVAEMAANARLIAEAGTVLHETGLTPRQLAEQRAALLEALAGLVSAVSWERHGKCRSPGWPGPPPKVLEALESALAAIALAQGDAT